MLRAGELPVSALTTPFKVGLGQFCRYSYDLDASEERSSDDQFDNVAQIAKFANAPLRNAGVPSGACRGGTRNATVACASWVPAFLAATYFQPCERHRHHKKNECTFFCISCGAKPLSVCQHCMGAHAGHQVIQVRRYVYCDVVRTCDINPYVDTTGVQNYIINSAKVMFLNHRPHSKIGRANGVDVCHTCQRHLREGYSYCSLACKVEALTKGDSPTSVTPAGSPSPAGPLPAPSTRLNSLMLAAAAGGASMPRAPRLPPASGSGSGGSSTAAGATARIGFLRAASLLPAVPSSPEHVSSGGGGAGGGGPGSDLESSEPGEDTVMYGSIGGSRTLSGSGSPPGAGARRRPAIAMMREKEHQEREGDHLSGSGSSEDDCCEFNFENPPKRRRSSLIGLRPSTGSYGPWPSATGAPDAAAAAAAATLLLPFRSASGPLHLGNRSSASGMATGGASSSCFLAMSPELQPASAGEDAAATLGAGALRSAASLTLSGCGMSRRKQTVPQRAPSC